jgi:CobQ-like glutamine amidotransferase family enzyme
VRLDLWHLYPQDMNIYGDRGNVIALVERARWRGIEVELHGCDVGDRLDAEHCDLIFAGGGQDAQQFAVAGDLRGAKAATLRELAEDDAPMLLVCGTYQLFGHYFRTGEGEIEGIGLLDLHTVAGRRRMIGDQVVTCQLDDGPPRTLVGFENHSGQTFLGAGCQPLGRVRGGGNNGQDGTAGVIYKRAYGCYLHGSLLPKNPRLGDLLLSQALERRHGPVELPKLDDSLESLAHSSATERAHSTH